MTLSLFYGVAEGVSTGSGGWGDLLATYGPFAPFAMLLLFILNLLWKDNKEKETEIKRLSETALEKILPLVLDATRVLSEAVETLKDSKDVAKNMNNIVFLVENLVEELGEVRKVIEHIPVPSRSGSPVRKRAPAAKKRT